MRQRKRRKGNEAKRRERRKSKRWKEVKRTEQQGKVDKKKVQERKNEGGRWGEREKIGRERKKRQGTEGKDNRGED